MRDRRAAQARGAQVAAALRGAWRTPPGAPATSGQGSGGQRLERPPALERASELVLGHGGGALLWRRIGAAGALELGEPWVTELRQAARMHALHAAVHEHELVAALRALREVGITPLLVKGWAVARWYPEPGLRPYGDLDLVVRPEEGDRARAALPRSMGMSAIDLHLGLPELEDRSLSELERRAERLEVGGEEVRVLGRADHLRFLCLHLLRHGAARALWLCDVAVAVEGAEPGIDWRPLTEGEVRRSHQVACVLGLARELLGADLSPLGALGAPAPPPRWLGEATLAAWGAPPHHEPLASYLRRPHRLAEALRDRWPNPIAGTATGGGRFDEGPRWPAQLRDLLRRTFRLGAELRAWGRAGAPADASPLLR